ncbi:MAG: hypothetical protein HWN68_06460 [Desulfobacterales bacterium]|nr:hypothetical protein [Desulfobacterales bacterium]
MNKLHCYSNDKSLCGIGSFSDLTTDWQHVTCKRCLRMYEDIKKMKKHFDEIDEKKQDK